MVWQSCNFYQLLDNIQQQLPYNKDKDDRWKFWKEPVQGTKNLFCGCGLKNNVFITKKCKF